MNEKSLLDYIVVGTVIALCVGLLVRYVKQTFFSSASSKGCSSCSDSKDCDKI